MTYPITPTNIRGLSNLSQMPLRVDKTGSIENADVFNLLNQGINTLQLTGQYSNILIGDIPSPPYYLSLLKASSNSSLGCDLRANFNLIDDSLLHSFQGDFLFHLHASLGQVSVTMSCQNTSSTSSFTLFPKFGFYVTTGYYEFGLEINTTFSVSTSNFFSLYLAAPTPYDLSNSDRLPVIQTTQTAMLQPINVPLATNNGTNWYSWATTSSNSGGTTNGFV